MTMPVSRRSVIRHFEVAAVFAAALAKRTLADRTATVEVVAFADRTERIPMRADQSAGPSRSSVCAVRRKDAAGASLSSVVSIVTLALGIGATTVVFSLTNALLLRPLPVQDPGTLVGFEEIEDGDYQLTVASSTFAQPFNGFNWLGPSLITPAIMFAYIWVTAGFAMVMTLATPIRKSATRTMISRTVMRRAQAVGGEEVQQRRGIGWRWRRYCPWCWGCS
jgi:hypothetical protein